MTRPDPGTGAADERPNRFPEERLDEVPALDEAPEGHTPAESTGADDESLPPG